MNEEERKQIGLDCIEIITKKISNQITPEQFSDALMGLHQKYPMPGHHPPLTIFQLKNYRSIMQVYADPDTGVKYWDHLQPWNFEEAAQMFYFHWQKSKGVDGGRTESEPTRRKIERDVIDLKARAAGEER
jgi:hypothetical protein